MPVINHYSEVVAMLPTRLFRLGRKNVPITYTTATDPSVFSNEFTIAPNTTVELMEISSSVSADLFQPKFIRIKWSAPAGLNARVVIAWEGTLSAINNSAVAMPVNAAGEFVLPAWEQPVDAASGIARTTAAIESITHVYIRQVNGSGNINVEIDAIE